MRKFLLVSAILGFLYAIPSFAQGATVTTTFTFNSPPGTSVTLTGTGPCTGTSSTATPGTITCTLPISQGTQVASVTVAPTGWSGGLTLSGTNASLFTVSGASPNYTLSAAAAITTPATGDSVTTTSTP